MSVLTRANTTESADDTLIHSPISKLIKHDVWNSDVTMKVFDEVTISYITSNYKSRYLGTIVGVQIASLEVSSDNGFLIHFLKCSSSAALGV